jgi:DNA polymerase delta subunit 1
MTSENFKRGGKKSSLEQKEDLFFQALTWEKEDCESEEEIEDEESSEDSEDKDFFVSSSKQVKNIKSKSLLVRVFGLTNKKETISLEIMKFSPYFYLNVPEHFTDFELKQLQRKIMSMLKKNNFYHETDTKIEKKFFYMHKLYMFDDGKEHKFIKLNFKSDSARWDAYKVLHDDKMIPDSSESFMVTKQIRINGRFYQFPIYEATLNMIIRCIDHLGVKPNGWLKVNHKHLHSPKKKTKCQFTYSVNMENVLFVESDEIAPFRISSFDIECVSEDGSFPQSNRMNDKVIQIGTTTRDVGNTYCQVRHIVCLKNCENVPDIIHEEKEREKVIVESYENERDLLHAWSNHIQEIDPDIITGYNIFGFDWKYLYERAKLLNCNQWFYHLGRIEGVRCELINQKLSSSAMGQNSLSYANLNGRVQIDMYKLIQREKRLPSYKLNNVAFEFLKINKHDLPYQQLFKKFFNGSPQDIKIIAEYCLQDCVLVNDLVDKLNVIPNSIGMANVCGIPLSYLFLKGQSVKVTSKITSFARKKNYCTPTLVKNHEKGEGYEGAVVFNPTPGLYFSPIAVLDYKSLYPSSMIEFNISHETYVGKKEYLNLPGYKYHEIEYDIRDEKDQIINKKKCIFAEKENQKGILPQLLEELLAARSSTKKRMKKAIGFMKTVYDGLQLAYKVVCNSVYGYLGANFSDLRFKDLAASTTAVGRLRLKYAKEEAEKYPGVKIVYGDTDSIFINCSEHKSLIGKKDQEALIEVIELGKRIAESITSQLSYPQELEYEKTFYPFMIITKKRYAGHLYEFDPTKYKFKSMGLAINRREFSPIVKKIYQKILDILFKEKNIKKAVSFYHEEIRNLLDGNVDIEDLVLSKTLKTNYVTPTAIAHKVLAEKIKERDPGNAPSSNDRIPYIFIDKNFIQCNEEKCFKKIKPDNCKCKKCMYLYCSYHLIKHNCIPKCRICWSNKKNKLCYACGGCFCSETKKQEETSHLIMHKCSTIKSGILQGDLVENPEYILTNNIKIDFRYYLDHQISNAVQQIFSLIPETKNKNILKNLLVKDDNRREGRKSITDFFSSQ